MLKPFLSPILFDDGHVQTEVTAATMPPALAGLLLVPRSMAIKRPARNLNRRASLSYGHVVHPFWEN